MSSLILLQKKMNEIVNVKSITRLSLNEQLEEKSYVMFHYLFLQLTYVVNACTFVHTHVQMLQPMCFDAQ